ncbi:low molecular weight phosphatase family protein [Candidatus Pacearchaeota archaeon]|nr:low molecular weight phosphatase family protein [Candidatus Pacearchaeota archaeon]
MNNPKIVLFVCKHNRFRSKVAEAFFNKFNKNKEFICMSAGLLPGAYPLDKIQVQTAKKFGIRISGRPKPITTDLLRYKVNLMVIVADNVPSEIFNNKKYGRDEIIWGIEDDYTGDNKEIERIIKKIEDKVKQLVGSLQ